MALGEVLNSLALIVTMMLPGFILEKFKIFKEKFYDGLSFLAVNLFIPALIIDCMQTDYSPELIGDLGKTFVLWLPMLVFAAVISFAFTKYFKYGKKQLTLAMCMLMVPNTGFVGIPLIGQLYGEESLFFASACEIVGDLFLYSAVFTAISAAAGRQSKISFKSLFLNPPIIALAIGLVLFLSGIKLPSFLGGTISKLNGCTAPIALFVLGSRLGTFSLKDFFGDKRIYVLCLLRLIVMPVFAFIILRIFMADTSLFSKVFILMQGMPAATVTTIVAQTYNSDADFAAKGVMLSTILSLVTLPVFAMIV